MGRNGLSQIASPLVTGGAGYNFENKVQSLFLFKMLTDGKAICTTFRKLPNNCPITAQKTMLAMIENPRATIAELSKSTNQSERTIKTHQKLLQESNLIRRIGSKKSGEWEILVK